MSPGNLYRYFPSKEALIAGIAERDRAEVGQQFASADLSHGFFTVLEDMARHYFTKWPQERVLLCTEVMSEARRNPEIARISSSFDADVKKWLGDMLRAAAERGDIPADLDFDKRHHHADVHRRRGVVAARAASPISTPRPCSRSSWTSCVTCCARVPKRSRPERGRAARGEQGELPMKASRLTAVGLVAAAGLWIASGHFLPHETAESRAAVRAGESEVKKLFRVAVVGDERRSAQPQADAVRSYRGRQASNRRCPLRRRDDGARVKRGCGSKRTRLSPSCPTRRARRRLRRRTPWSISGAPSSKPSES